MAACWGVLCHIGAGQVFLHTEAGVLLPSLIFHVVLFLDIMSPLCYLWFHVLIWLSLWERSSCGGEVWRSWDVEHRHPMGLQGASTHPRDLGRVCRPEEGEWVERYLIIPIAESASRKSLWKRWDESPSSLLL